MITVAHSTSKGSTLSALRCLVLNVIFRSIITQLQPIFVDDIAIDAVCDGQKVASEPDRAKNPPESIFPR